MRIRDPALLRLLHFEWVGDTEKFGRARSAGQYFRIGSPRARFCKAECWHPDVHRHLARRWFALQPCSKCGSKDSERHHIDGNPSNNEPWNLKFLCRRCHMDEDGRMMSRDEAGRFRSETGAKTT